MAHTESSHTFSLTRITAGVARVLDGPSRGERQLVGTDAIVVGSGEACDLRIRDTKVSARHCEISAAAHGFRVKDLGSRNGVYLDGSKVSEVIVRPGAILKLGRSHLFLGVADSGAALVPSERTQFGELVGVSLPMRRAFTLLELAAQGDAPVLLTGETGTGKELAARAIHQASRRRGKPLETVDCGSVSPQLVQSQLFGHERGAFTGAVEARAGVFERADGGTVFLDEIGELPSDLQPVLLRLCDRGELQRLGASQTMRVDVRPIVATWRDLSKEVLEKRFRSDLFYRLAVFPIALPALRARREDLPLLCDSLLRRLGMAEPGPIEGTGLAVLEQHDWPGNVRELRNVLERAVLVAGPGARFADLRFQLDSPLRREPLLAASGSSFQEKRKSLLQAFEREYLRDLLAATTGNLKRAARLSGIERTQLKRLLRRNGLL